MNVSLDGHTLTIAGIKELDAATASAFRDAIIDALDHSVKDVEVDLSQAVFLDGVGLGALVALRKALNPHGVTVRLLNPAPQAVQIIELARLHRLFEIVNRGEVVVA